jgi:hypothetical protein
MESTESLDIIEVLVCRAAKLEKLMKGSLVASSSQVFRLFLPVDLQFSFGGYCICFRGILYASTVVTWFWWNCSYQPLYSNSHHLICEVSLASLCRSLW